MINGKYTPDEEEVILKDVKCSRCHDSVMVKMGVESGRVYAVNCLYYDSNDSLQPCHPILSGDKRYSCGKCVQFQRRFNENNSIDISLEDDSAEEDLSGYV